MTDSAPTRQTLHLMIHGRVQGVFYRDSMRREASKLGVTGWVRNCVDGSVEAVVQGDTAAVKAIVQWAHRGSERAAVEKVETEPAEGVYTGFEVLR